MNPTEFHLSNGTAFLATEAIGNEKRNGVLFITYEGRWLGTGRDAHARVAINPTHIVSFVEDTDV